MTEPKPTIGYLAQVACTWEVLARKAGNVCPRREFHDLTVDDFLMSAAAIAPVLNEACEQPLGMTILRAIEATRRVVQTNTNLGIVLLLAPLASVPIDQPIMPGVSSVLRTTTVEDSRDVYAAIRLAQPGGLGAAPEQDVAAEPTLPLREVMALAKGRDRIAEQYATDFEACLGPIRTALLVALKKAGTVEQAIIETQLQTLFWYGDDLISRKRGERLVEETRRRVDHVIQRGLDTRRGGEAYRDLDAWLRSDGNALNPGTTADLIAAALFAALREGEIPLSTPFAWDAHPFAEG